MAAVVVELVRSADWAGGVVLVNGHGGNRDAVDRGRRRRWHGEGRRVLAWWPRIAGRRRPRRAHRDVADAGAAARARATRAGGGRRDGAARRARRPAARRGRQGGLAATACSATRPAPTAGTARRSSRRSSTTSSAPSTRGPRAAPMTTYSLDASTHRPAGSDVVIGGSPLRRVPPDRRRHRAPSSASPPATTSTPGPAVDGLVDRLLDAGAIHPHPRRRRSRPADVTVVVPALVLGESALARDRALLPGRRRRHRRRRRVRAAGRTPSTGPGCCGCAPTPDRPSPATPASARSTTPLVAFVDTDVRLQPGWLDLAARPLRRPSGRPRRAPRRQRPRRRPGGRLRAGPLAARPRPRAGPDRARHPAQLRPGRRPRRAHRRRCGRSAASTARCASARTSTPSGASSRPGGAAATSRRRSSTTGHAGSWRGARRPARRYGSSAAPLARRHRGALAPVRMSGWSGGGVGARSSAGHPVLGRSPSPAAPRPPSCASCPACRPRESLRLAGLGHLHAGRLLADAGRRAWWPLLARRRRSCRARVRRIAALAAVPALLGGGIPRLVDDLAYGVGRVEGRARRARVRPRSCPASRRGPAGRRRRPSTTPTVGRATTGGPQRRYRRRVTLRLTVDTDTWRANVDHVRPPLPRAGPRRQGQRLRLRAGRARRASPPRLADTIAVGTVHELDHVPAGRHAGRADADAGARRPTRVPILTVGSVAHVQRPRRLARPGARQAGLVGAPLRHDDRGARRPSRRRPGPPGSTSSASASTRRSPAPTTSTSTTSPRGSACSTDDDEVWVSHLSPAAYDALVDALARAPLPHPPRHRAVARRQAGAAPRRRRARRPTRRGPATHAGYRQQRRARRRPPRDGRRRHRPRRAAARRRPQPVPLRPPAARAARAAAHAHVDGCSCPAGQIGPGESATRRRAAPADHLVRRRGALAMRSDGVAATRPARHATVVGRRHRAPARARRRARRRPDRRRRDELPRLPDPARRRRRGDGAVDRLLRPVDRAAVDPLRGDVRARRRRRRDAADPRARRRRPPALVSARRWTLVRRGLALYGAGLLFDTIWPGTILPYYGAMFVLAARPVHAARAAGSSPSAPPPPLAGAGIAWWGLERRLDGRRHGVAVRARRSVAARPAVRRRRQRHPPAAAVAGVLLRRHRARARADDGLVAAGGDRRRADAVRAGHDDLRRRRRPATARRCWRAPTRSTAGCSTRRARSARRSSPSPRSPGWPTASATAAPIELLRHAGAMSLTLYVAHALVFNLVVDWLGWVRPTGLDTALTVRRPPTGSSAIAAASWWHRRFGIGPAEWLYRRLGGMSRGDAFPRASVGWVHRWSRGRRCVRTAVEDIDGVDRRASPSPFRPIGRRSATTRCAVIIARQGGFGIEFVGAAGGRGLAQRRTGRAVIAAPRADGESERRGSSMAPSSTATRRRSAARGPGHGCASDAHRHASSAAAAGACAALLVVARLAAERDGYRRSSSRPCRATRQRALPGARRDAGYGPSSARVALPGSPVSNPPEPHALLGRAVGEAVAVDLAAGLLLDAVVADGRGGVERLADLARLELAAASASLAQAPAKQSACSSRATE